MINQKKIPRYNSAPSKNEGKDNESRIVVDEGNVYLYYKLNKEWFRVKFNKV